MRVCWSKTKEEKREGLLEKRRKRKKGKICWSEKKVKEGKKWRICWRKKGGKENLIKEKSEERRKRRN